MQYKGDLAFSLYCITSFSLSTTFVGNWTVGVVHEELPLILLPPGIVAGGPLPWAGLTVAASKILQMDNWFIIFVGTCYWLRSACPGKWWIACLSEFYCFFRLRWKLGWSLSVEVHVIEPWKSLLLGLQPAFKDTSHLADLLELYHLRGSWLIPTEQ